MEAARYRFPSSDFERADNYIDLPLSAAHPTLSMLALRSIFPNLTLSLHRYWTRNSTCPEIPAVRAAYNQYFCFLDAQVEKLQLRLLVLAGYPTKYDQSIQPPPTTVSMLDVAESLESAKYSIHVPKTFAGPLESLRGIEKGKWTIGSDNELDPLKYTYK